MLDLLTWIAEPLFTLAVILGPLYLHYSRDQ